MEEITRLTGITKKGPAIRKLLADTLTMQRRAEIAAKFVSGEWSAELEGYEAAQVADRQHSTTLAEQWRD
ncbi:hypothetical protein FEM03_17765 [Phragmitibacter flavus]|uniref:Uncharacterized protein n=1 Tax=Phragmitibacter flavus TaxID=2576071 RepID=A0A5R8KB38_9BACT|nr:hypothetical protein FEM03_17765 [Phragmitibacter flavus]